MIKSRYLIALVMAASTFAGLLSSALTADHAFAKKKDRQSNAEWSDIDAAAASLSGKSPRSSDDPAPNEKNYWRSQKKLEDMYLDRAKKLAEKKNFSEALSIVRSAIIKFGYDSDLHKAEDTYSLEVANREMSDDAAIRILDGVLEWNPQNQRARDMLAARLRNKGLDIGSFNDRVAYARQLLAEGDTETAIREFQAALKLRYDAQIIQLVGQLKQQRLQPPGGQNY